MITTPLLQAIKHLDEDLRLSLLRQVRDLWTHSSTALEGNTLTLSETKFVIEEGLTISGKPLKDHQEVIGHAAAIDLVYAGLERPVTEQDLFALHRAVQTVQIMDIYKPNGAWKVDPNGTDAITRDNRQVFIEYARPADVPPLMAEWLQDLNALSSMPLPLDDAIEAYARLHMGFVHVHPFWDGNGRMARLLSNLPLLHSGWLPLVVENSQRQEYIQVLTDHHLAAGQLDKRTGVWPNPDLDRPFTEFCRQAYNTTLHLLDQAEAAQEHRDGPDHLESL